MSLGRRLAELVAAINENALRNELNATSLRFRGFRADGSDCIVRIGSSRHGRIGWETDISADSLLPAEGAVGKIECVMTRRDC